MFVIVNQKGNRGITMKRKLLIDDDKSIYELNKSEDTVKLIRSELDKEWVKPNTVTAEIYDTHNYIELQLDNKRKITLDYSQAFEAFLVLKEYYNNTVIKEMELK